MPKLIENLEANLIREARKQLEEKGYAAVTIRSVAAGCGVGVGTVYNYFPSKDALLASYMLEDWNRKLECIRQTAAESDHPEPVLRCLHQQLCLYIREHQAVFRDETASMGFAGSFSRYHALLRSQLAQPLERFCESSFAAEFMVESLLTWTVAGKDFSEIYGMIRKLI